MPPMSALWLCRFAQTSAAVLLAGTAALRLLAGGTPPGGGRAAGWGKLGVGSGLVLAGAAGGQLVLTAAAMSGLPWAQACSREVLGSVVEGTRFGTVWLVRMGVLGVLGLGWIVGKKGRWPEEKRGWTAGLATGAAGLLATLVWAGHAGASASRGWLLPVGVAHAVAAGAWPGGLAPLAMLLRRARVDAGLVPAAVTVTRRFSRLSVVAVGVLALSGSLDAWALVGTWSGLWTSGYGRLVLAKAGLFAVMVGVGAANRRWVTREAAGMDAAETLRRLWRNVAAEGVLAVLVVLATEALAMSAPPGGRVEKFCDGSPRLARVAVAAAGRKV